MGTWADLSFAPSADVSEALKSNNINEPLVRCALECGMHQAEWSWNGLVVTASDAELRCAEAWEPFLAQLRLMGIAYDEKYEADRIGAMYIERWRAGMDTPVTAAYVEGDHAVTLRDLASLAFGCATADDLVGEVRRHVGAALPPLSACVTTTDDSSEGDVVLRLPLARPGPEPD